MASGSNDSQLPSVNIESADHTTLIVEPESSGPLSSLFIGNVAETVNVTGAVDSVSVHTCHLCRVDSGQSFLMQHHSN